MDLKQLRTFLEVGDRGSLTRAADSLNIAQPALGRQIKQLEEELGVALFERHGRGMALTASGRTLAERAHAILRLVEEARAEISAEQGAVKGAVSLGVPPTVGEVLAGRLVERFLMLHPAVTVRIVPAFSGYLHDLLRRGEVDLAVMYETSGAGQIRSEPLIVESLALIGAAGSMRAWTGPIPFGQLAGLPLVLPGPRQGLRTLLEQEALRAAVSLKVIVEADALQTLRDLARRGIGFTVLPLAAVGGELRQGSLEARLIGAPSLMRRLVLSRSLSRPVSSAVRIFAETLKSETAAMVAEGAWEGELQFRP